MITKLSKIFGKEVYTLSGARVGRVVDVAIDVESRKVSEIFISNLDQSFQKAHELEGKKGIIYPYTGVRGVGDILLITEPKQKPKEKEEEPRGVIGE